MIIDINAAQKQLGGKRLKAAREALGMTKTATAAAIGVSLNTYRLWENGELRPIPERAEKIGQVLNIPTEQVPMRGRRKPATSRPVNTDDPAKAERFQKYAPYRARRLELGLHSFAAGTLSSGQFFDFFISFSTPTTPRVLSLLQGK